MRLRTTSVLKFKSERVPRPDYRDTLQEQLSTGLIKYILKAKERMSFVEIAVAVHQEWRSSILPPSTLELKAHLQSMLGTNVAKNSDETYTLLDESVLR